MNPTLSLICDLGVKSALLALPGLCVAHLATQTASWRALALTCTLFAMAALPLLHPLVPTITLPRFAPKFALATTASQASFADEVSRTSEPTPTYSARKRDVVAWIWGLGTLCLGAYVGIGYLGLRRWKCAGAPAPQQIELQDAATELSIHKPAMLLESPECRVPVTWGWIRPIVLLPTRARQWPLALRRQVLLHELAHVRRADWLAQLCIQTICAAYWWNPLFWLCARLWKTACEQACDDLVLSRAIQPSEYAGNLLSMANSFSSPKSAALALIQPPRLTRRIRSILDSTMRREPVSAMGKATIATISVLACVTTAGLANAPSLAAPVAASSEIFPISSGRLSPAPFYIESDNTKRDVNSGKLSADGHATFTYPGIVLKADHLDISPGNGHNWQGVKVVGRGNTALVRGTHEIVATRESTIMIMDFDKNQIDVIGPHRTVVKKESEKPAAAQQAK